MKTLPEIPIAGETQWRMTLFKCPKCMSLLWGLETRIGTLLWCDHEKPREGAAHWAITIGDKTEKVYGTATPPQLLQTEDGWRIGL